MATSAAILTVSERLVGEWIPNASQIENEPRHRSLARRRIDSGQNLRIALGR